MIEKSAREKSRTLATVVHGNRVMSNGEADPDKET